MPRRLSRIRRMMESKRLDSFREFHESLKKTAKEEQEFLKGFFKNTQDMFEILKKDDEEEDDVA